MKKKKLYIIRRVFVMMLLGLYVTIAMLNSTIVQSYLGAAVSSHLSKEWGGKVRIGAIHLSPISHVIANKIELISPTNDTIYMGDRISCRFKHFPYRKSSLSFDFVSVRNGRFHLESIKYPSGKNGINLDYIIQYYDTGKPHTKPTNPFKLDVGELRFSNIDYAMDLPEPEGNEYGGVGVDIPHMRFHKTSGHVRRIHLINDSIKCRIVSFSTTERSGQHIVDMSADVVVSPHMIKVSNLDLQTDESRVFADAELTYKGWEGMSDYLADVQHDALIKEGTEVNICDAAYWAPDLWGMNCKATLQGHVYGTINNMFADDVVAAFGNESYAYVDGKISGLPDISNTYFDIDLHRLHTNYADLAAVHHPEHIKMILPELLEKMGNIDIDASLRGNYKECQAFINYNSMIGDIEAQAMISFDSSKMDYTYMGDLDSRMLGIRSVIPNEWVSRSGFHLSFHGTGFDPKTMEASLEGRLYNTQFKGNDIDRTSISADIAKQEINADIVLKDTLINLDISASANLADKECTADLIIKNAQLSTLKVVQSDSNVALSTHLRADILGDSLETLSGSIALNGTHLQLGSRNIDLHSLAVDASQTNGFKNITLNSDWLLMTIKGYYHYADLPLVVRDFCDRYLPTYYNPYRDKDSVDMTPLYADNFDIDVLWNDENNTIANLLPDISISSGTAFHGSYNYGEALKMVLRSNRIAYGNLVLNDIGANSSALGENYQFRIKATSLALGDREILDNLQLTTGLGSSISTLSLTWDDNKPNVQNEGDLEFFFTSTPTGNKLMIAKPSFYAMGQRWSLVCPNGILINNEKLAVDNLKIYGMGQSVTLKALLSGDDNDYVKAAFDDFVLDNISTLLIPNNALAVKGKLDGLFNVKGLHSRPYFDANLTIDDCYINGEPAGKVDIKSNYHAQDSKLYVDMLAEHIADNHEHRPLELHGDMTMEGKDPALNFELTLDGVALKTASPVLASIANQIDGKLSGHMLLSGRMSAPLLKGNINISEGQLELAPTGVTYYFDDDLVLSHDSLLLDNFIISDKLGNKVLTNGSLSLKQNTLMLNLGINTKRILALDKESGEGNEFYGKLLASAQGNITGPVDKLRITATASTLAGSELYVPVDNRKQVSENEFVTFISRSNTTRRSSSSTQRKESSNLDLLLNLHVTPGVKFHLPMDFDQLAANVTAIGQGDVQVTLRGGQTPNILGNYEFTSGNFNLSLMQLFTKSFSIEEGSTINFPGDINNARFDISAVYNLRANLATLMNNSISTTNDTYVQVQDIISLSGSILDPTIKFDIRIPNAEQNVVDQVFSYIDRNNELEMLNQSISLLLLGQFVSNGSTNNNESGMGEGNSIGYIASTAGNLISSMVKVVDVDFKYQAATSTAAGQFDVGISKSWNKLYFESTFGYGTGNSEMDVDQSNTLVGDVEMGYKFTPYFNFYGFHRTNTSYYTRTELPYKQGIGVKLSKDFDSFLDLAPWLRKKKKTTQQ